MLTLKKYILSSFCRARQNSGVNASCVRSACRSLSLGGGRPFEYFDASCVIETSLIPNRKHSAKSLPASSLQGGAGGDLLLCVPFALKVSKDKQNYLSNYQILKTKEL